MLLDFDFGWFVCLGVYGAVVGVEVYICACILSDEFSLAQVEFEVVVLCCALDKAQDFLAPLCCASQDDCVVSIGQIPEGVLLAM